MSKLGKRLIQAAREGVAIARGELDPATYRVHHGDDVDAARSRVSFMHQSGPGMFKSASMEAGRPRRALRPQDQEEVIGRATSGEANSRRAWRWL